MTLSGMTPAEQVAALGLAVGDTIEGRLENGKTWAEYRRKLAGAINGNPVWLGSSIGSEFEGRWMEPIQHGPLPHITSDWRKISSDPSIDPLTPLREQLTQGWAIMDRLYNLTCHTLTKDERYPVRAWLGKNGAFGPGKGEGDE